MQQISTTICNTLYNSVFGGGNFKFSFFVSVDTCCNLFGKLNNNNIRTRKRRSIGLVESLFFAPVETKLTYIGISNGSLRSPHGKNHAVVEDFFIS